MPSACLHVGTVAPLFPEFLIRPGCRQDSILRSQSRVHTWAWILNGLWFWARHRPPGLSLCLLSGFPRFPHSSAIASPWVQNGLSDSREHRKMTQYYFQNVVIKSHGQTGRSLRPVFSLELSQTRQPGNELLCCALLPGENLVASVGGRWGDKEEVRSSIHTEPESTWVSWDPEWAETLSGAILPQLSPQPQGTETLAEASTGLCWVL